MSDATREVSLWLNNDQDLYREVESLAENALQEACDNESHATTARNDAVEQLAGEIQTVVEHGMPQVEGLWGSLLSTVLNSIDFEEVARDWLADKVIFSVFSSDEEEAELFTDIDAARGYLEEKLDDDNTMHAGLFLAVAKLAPGGKVDIDGITYCLVAQ